MSSLIVLTPFHPDKIEHSQEDNHVTVSDKDKAKDALDKYNHPRLRRALILSNLASREGEISFSVPAEPLDSERWMKLYASVHSEGLLRFLSSSWAIWSSYREGLEEQALRCINSPLLRDPSPQRASKSPTGLMGYYCSDADTPVFADLLDELLMDGKLIQEAVENVSTDNTVYAIVTHPGHHAAEDCFGGYCYTNHVATMARMFQTTKGKHKVAILDVDYHVGNGTASIFYKDPSVFVVSIHCDPDYDYPFHSGFADERGEGEAEGTILHLPLPPETDWNVYSQALGQGCRAIQEFGAEALIVSMGLDTYDQDPVCLRRAGFKLQGDDYVSMGTTIAEYFSSNIPVIFLQEGGYRMERIGQAAADVVTSFCKARKSASLSL